MKAAGLCLFLLLGACSQPQQESLPPAPSLISLHPPSELLVGCAASSVKTPPMGGIVTAERLVDDIKSAQAAAAAERTRADECAYRFRRLREWVLDHSEGG